MTSSRGEYWRLLVPGDYVVSVKAHGYQTSQRRTVRVTNATDGAQVVDFQLKIQPYDGRRRARCCWFFLKLFLLNLFFCFLRGYRSILRKSEHFTRVASRAGLSSVMVLNFFSHYCIIFLNSAKHRNSGRSRNRSVIKKCPEDLNDIIDAWFLRVDKNIFNSVSLHFFISMNFCSRLSGEKNAKTL